MQVTVTLNKQTINCNFVINLDEAQVLFPNVQDRASNSLPCYVMAGGNWEKGVAVQALDATKEQYDTLERRTDIGYAALRLLNINTGRWTFSLGGDRFNVHQQYARKTYNVAPQRFHRKLQFNSSQLVYVRDVASRDAVSELEPISSNAQEAAMIDYDASPLIKHPIADHVDAINAYLLDNRHVECEVIGRRILLRAKIA